MPWRWLRMLDFAATDTIQYLCRQVFSWLLGFRGLQEGLSARFVVCGWQASNLETRKQRFQARRGVFGLEWINYTTRK